MGFFSLFGSFFKRCWEILSTVYSYNSLPWRFLKSGALVVFGFFNFMAGNLLYSYKPDWEFLRFFMSYGSLLIIYGPIHHLLIIPLSLRLGRYSWARNLRIPRWGHVIMLILFFNVVIYFGVYPLDIMTFEIEAQGLMVTTDVNPDVNCWRPSANSSKIECKIPHEKSISRVDVETKGKTIISSDTTPFQFSVKESEIKEVVGRKSFSIILRDKSENILRRYVQQPALIEPRDRSK